MIPPVAAFTGDVVTPALVGLATYTATLLASVPTRIANWSIRRQGLELDLLRIDGERDDALADMDTEYAGQRRAILGPGQTHAIVGGSDTDISLRRAQANSDQAKVRLRREAELRRSEVQKELDAGWWTHLFAERCQGGHQPRGLRSTFPAKAPATDGP
jgi:hypothetical protein